MATANIAAAQAPADWKAVKVPEVWKNPLAGIDNLSWYRGFVKAPDAWKGKELELFVEPTDAAHEVFFNGKKVGGAGEFPPFFRSGLGGAERFFVAADAVRYDAPNVVAIRVYSLEARSGFNIAAPVLFGEKEAVRMAGDTFRRNKFRTVLRDRMLNSPLTDGPRFSQALESIYRQVWTDYCHTPTTAATP